MDELSRQAEEHYLERVIRTIDERLTAYRDRLPAARATFGSISNRDFSAKVGAAITVARTRDQLGTLQELRSKPYFGRVDFRENGADELIKAYVGMAHLEDAGGSDYLVYDWRTPIGGLYYEGRLGAAAYRAPGGVIEGQILRRREYVIANGQLRSIYDSDPHAAGAATSDVAGSVDDLLQSLLDRSADGRMRQIVQSIQVEQNAVIRNEGELLAVQGPAGSGKTIVALHRAAYLLYQLRQKRGVAGTAGVSAQRMMVLSPSEIYSEYVSRVLPDLQEDQIQRVRLEQVCLERLRRLLRWGRKDEELTLYRIERKQEHHELLLRANAGIRLQTSAFKSSVAMLAHIQGFAEKLEREVEEGLRDVTVTDHEQPHVIVARQQLVAQLSRNSDRTGLFDRIEEVVRFTRSKVENYSSSKSVSSRTAEEAITQQQQLCKWIKKYQKRDIVRLYREMWQAIVQDSDTLPISLGAIATFTIEALDRRYIPFEDIVPILTLAGLLVRVPSLGEIDHAIIDEAQDYSILDYAYLKRCLPASCAYTIVGDVNQACTPAFGISSYEDLRHVFRSRLACLELSRSYRSTSEITEFARKILGDEVQVESVRRSGRNPRVTIIPEGHPVAELMAESISTLRASGRKLIAVICKTALQSRELHEELSRHMAVALLTGNSTGLTKGVFVLPVYLAKGLEFDAVIVADVSGKRYGSDRERRLLYTACTRALHDLHLICAGKLSPLISDLELLDVELVDVPASDAAAESVAPPAEAFEIEVTGAGKFRADGEADTEITSGAPANGAPVPGNSEGLGWPATETELPPIPDLSVPAVASPPVLTLPTANGGSVEIRFSHRVSKTEFDRIRRMFELSEPAFVDEE
jgi:DNA helicase-2/ATP-dependent DNA helicase PcrA